MANVTTAAKVAIAGLAALIIVAAPGELTGTAINSMYTMPTEQFYNILVKDTI